MGLFGGKKTYVSSSVYNLAGDVAKRPNYLREIVAGSVLSSDSNKSIADSIRAGYSSGPGVRLRQFARWANDNYNGPMQIAGQGIASAPELDATHVIALITTTEPIAIQSVYIGIADFEVWAEQWMFANQPLQFSGAWVATYNETTGAIHIDLPDGTSAEFSPADFQKGTFYVYSTYSLQASDGSWAPVQVFIYRLGAGASPYLDNLLLDMGGFTEFLPPIPIRFNNEFLSESFSPNEYALSKKAYSKLTGGASYDSLITTLSSNEHLGDMDFIYAFPGVTLNTKENACRKYLYNFFEHCMFNQIVEVNQYNDWYAAANGSGIVGNEWDVYLAAYAASHSVDVGNNSPISSEAAPPPELPYYANSGKNTVELSSGSGLNYKIHINWRTISEDFGNGLAKPDAKPGDVWLDSGSRVYETGQVFIQSVVMQLAAGTGADTVEIWWQIDSNNWKRLTIEGLEHENFVYNGSSVKTTAAEALADGDESGFLVPLHWDTFKAMSIVDTTQMSTACIYLVVNAYKIVKQQWWQTGFFQIILFVAIVVVSIYFPPAAGLLGPAASVGAALGFTGFAAILAGTIINVLAAMLLMKIIGIVAVAALGDKIGSIVAAVASLIALQVTAGFMNGASLAESFSSIMNPVNLIQASEAVGNGVAGFIQAGVQDILHQTQDVLNQYNQQAKAISDAYAQNMPYGIGAIDPTMLNNTSQWYAEPRDTFLSRTLMTGSDIAELSTSLISRFSELTLSTDLPI